jgi:hypothetical protein
MCKGNKELFIILLVFLLFCCLAAALRAQEPGPWYLISEAELRNIELYKEKSEAERQGWLSQVQELRKKAESSEARAARLAMESGNLNAQLAQARERNRRLEQSFDEYEQGNLTLISSKNGEIADLKQAAMEERLGKEKYKGMAGTRLAIIIALAGCWVLFLGFKIYRKFRPI